MKPLIGPVSGGAGSVGPLVTSFSGLPVRFTVAVPPLAMVPLNERRFICRVPALSFVAVMVVALAKVCP